MAGGVVALALALGLTSPNGLVSFELTSDSSGWQRSAPRTLRIDLGFLAKGRYDALVGATRRLMTDD
jgi:hypothetical protein